LEIKKAQIEAAEHCTAIDDKRKQELELNAEVADFLMDKRNSRKTRQKVMDELKRQGYEF